MRWVLLLLLAGCASWSPGDPVATVEVAYEPSNDTRGHHFTITSVTGTLPVEDVEFKRYASAANGHPGSPGCIFHHAGRNVVAGDVARCLAPEVLIVHAPSTVVLYKHE